MGAALTDHAYVTCPDNTAHSKVLELSIKNFGAQYQKFWNSVLVITEMQI